MVNIKGHNVNITKELQDFLIANPPKTVRKPVLSKKKDELSGFEQERDSDGELKFVSATINTHPNVYFDELGRFYLNVFRTTILEDGREIIVTNPKFPTKSDCALYGKGVISHMQVIPGSELWDNGSTSLMPTREAICKGKEDTKIVLTLTRDEVIAVDLKPTGDNIVAKIANLSDAERAVLRQYLDEKSPLDEE